MTDFKQNIDLKINVDSTDANKQIKTLQDTASEPQEIPVSLDLTALKKDKADIEKQLSGLEDSKINIRLDQADFKKDIKFINKEIQDLTASKKEIKLDSSSVEEAAKKIKAVDKQIKDLKDSKFEIGLKSDDAIKNLRKVTDESNKLSKSLKTIDVNIKTTEAQGNLKDLQNSLDDVKEAASGGLGLGDILAGGALVAGVGAAIDAFKQLGEATEAVRTLQLQISALTGASGADLDRFTANIQATASVFNQDVNELTIATKALAEGFGIDFAEAGNKVAELFARGANATDELIPSLKEFSSLAKSAGLDLEDFAGILETGAESGIFADKLIDSIKEINLRLSELPDATQDALAPLGKEFNNQLFDDLKSGALSTTDAFLLIGEQAKIVGLDVQELATLTADLGGGPLEDLGGFERGFELISQAVNKTNVELTESEKNILAQQKASEKLGNVLVPILAGAGDAFSTLNRLGKELTADVLTALIPVFNTIGEVVGELFDALSGLFDNFTDGAEDGAGALDVFKIAIEIIAAPLRIVIKAIALIVEAIDFLDERFGIISQTIEGLVNVIDLISKASDAVLEFLGLQDSEEERLAKEQKKRAEEAKKLEEDKVKEVKKSTEEVVKLETKKTAIVKGLSKEELAERKKLLAEQLKINATLRADTEKSIKDSIAFIKKQSEQVEGIEIKAQARLDKNALDGLKDDLEDIEDVDIDLAINTEGLGFEAIEDQFDVLQRLQDLAVANAKEASAKRVEIVEEEARLRVKAIETGRAKEIKAEEDSSQKIIDNLALQIQKINDSKDADSETSIAQVEALTNQITAIEESSAATKVAINKDANTQIKESEELLVEDKVIIKEDEVEQIKEIDAESAEGKEEINDALIDKRQQQRESDLQTLAIFGLDGLAKIKEFAETEEEIAEAKEKAKQDLAQATSTIINQLGQKNAALAKALAVTQATIDGFLAVQNALANVPPPFNFVAAAVVGIAAAINVANIISTPIGGAFIGTDRVSEQDQKTSTPHQQDTLLYALAKDEQVVSSKGANLGDNRSVIAMANKGLNIKDEILKNNVQPVINESVIKSNNVILQNDNSRLVTEVVGLRNEMSQLGTSIDKSYRNIKIKNQFGDMNIKTQEGFELIKNYEGAR